MAFGRNNVFRNRNSWGPVSSCGTVGLPRPDPEEEHTERMATAQMRQLDPLKEDLADWLNKTLGTDYINRDNFLTELDNGVVICHLAQLICDTARRTASSGLGKMNIPNVRGKCFEKAMRRSFFSRDNVANFLKFCRSLGVHENLLFESDDLVLHNQPRSVILCLLEVARIATKYGIEPPGLVQLEKEIAEEERHQSGDSGLSSLLSWQFQTSPPRLDASDLKMSHSRSTSAISHYADSWSTGPHVLLIKADLQASGDGDTLNSMPTIKTSGASDGVPSDNTEDDEWSGGSPEDPDLDMVDSARKPRDIKGGGDAPSQGMTTELDRKVQLAARLMQRNCNCASGKCDKLRVRKVGEGKYNIAGKNVFIRLLKGRHMMVRVGGGWDTLDHFLLRHDPCQVKVVSRDSPDRDASKYLHIRAKYRSPPPREARESVTR
ncbi:growth arrest-specific protein 2 isoform X2 [Dendroctonus ponderosae]|nr:growth arrest-specific protein 2 isoform X2 [Dendroctonus ponderosae]XP_048526091.1 growth arrest-specific protein 2 isoform X2 [Dendroctonus ponderosae]XP_048526092.1 growth arrest-specific protein 2 isoform X2 [Dendroctonus ponderosae]XP_048526093.1 growth arrest-specific protein 2 isoform X2 [Dendroctonus ponderosae]XP_048526094.1 growth arrest-specific protein 2 isoform X2 [Dendroctonus ponderosae]XP_048526095.1 growth arrest-specific protein 2 isoform X2 [Dendroctonus ponderosae]